jgi:two-component system cell cycle sensor histidine kinase PleC
MSHELRTPLNAIIGFSDIVQQEMFGPIGVGKYGEYVKDIHSSGEHLLAIINDILDLAKAESGKLSLQESEFDLAVCVENCLRMCRARALSGDVELITQFSRRPIMVHADERLMLQLLLNLVTNAVKFTPKGGKVSVITSADYFGPVRIIVLDTGIGIAPDDIARVQRPFEQVENSKTRTHGGTGLGLPYAKKLAELHGGTLSIESKVDHGTAITLLLPNARQAPQRAAQRLKQAV